MNFYNLRRLGRKLYFTTEDVADIFNIKYASAKVLCTRYVEKGVFIRLKRNFYILSDIIDYLKQEDFFKIANNLQVPSYISLFTALSYHGVLKQGSGTFIESICLKRTKIIDIGTIFFNFFKIKKEFFNGFIEKNGILIAEKEKAFIDAVYLYSFGKYSPDFSLIDFKKLEKEKIKKLSSPFPEKTKKIIKKLISHK